MMTRADRHRALEAHHQAVQKFLASARAVAPAQWDQPRSAGKWSRAQVVEHLALAYEASCEALQGRATGPVPPRALRPLLRTLLLRPILWLGRFPTRLTAPASLQPNTDPADAPSLLSLLESATNRFAAQAAAASSDHMDHPAFGRLTIVDFIRFQEIHTRHHRSQLT